MVDPESQAEVAELPGGLTAAAGWTAGATYTGIRSYGPEPRFDLGLLLSERPATAAALFTRNAVVGAPSC